MPGINAGAALSDKPPEAEAQFAGMQAILMSDLHLRDPNGSTEAASHAASICVLLDRASETCPGVAFCILSGDLADRGEPGAYR